MRRNKKRNKNNNNNNNNETVNLWQKKKKIANKIKRQFHKENISFSFAQSPPGFVYFRLTAIWNSKKKKKKKSEQKWKLRTNLKLKSAPKAVMEE